MEAIHGLYMGLVFHAENRECLFLPQVRVVPCPLT